MKEQKKSTERLLLLIGNMSNRAFADKCGFDEKVVRNIKKGKIPGRAVLEKIAEKTNKTVDWILGKDVENSISSGAYDELKHKTTPDSGRISTPSDIPVVGKVPAGSPNTNDWDVEYNIQVPGMPAHCYAMLVTGDSMEPRIMEGEHVIFTIDYTLKPGNVVIVNNEYGESMVKRYQEKDGRQYFVSDNSRYEPVEPNDGYSIVGKVINSVLIKKH